MSEKRDEQRTVEELIEILRTFPKDALVFCRDANGDVVELWDRDVERYEDDKKVLIEG